MNKAKFMLTAFAVFGSILMLMTSAVAGPTQEKVNLETLELKEARLVESIKDSFKKFQNDEVLKSIASQISNEREVRSASLCLQQSDDDKEISASIGLYFDAIERQIKEGSYLEKYLNLKYSEEASVIAAQSMDYAKSLESSNTISPDEKSSLVIQSLVGGQETGSDGDIVLLGAFMPAGSLVPVDGKGRLTEIGDRCEIYLVNEDINSNDQSGEGDNNTPHTEDSANILEIILFLIWFIAIMIDLYAILWNPIFRHD